MELFYIALGAFMLYSAVHSIVLGYNKAWSMRSGYEKFITITGTVCIAIVFFTIMSS